jgi:mandelate racemase
MKIKSFHIQCVQVPLAMPITTASGTVGASPLVLLTVRTDKGLEGSSIVFTYTPLVLRSVADIIGKLEVLVVGAPLDPREVAQQLQSRFKLLGTHGMLGMAIAGIDMALWDAYARLREQPLYKLLGGAPKKIPAYGCVGLDGAVSGVEQATAAIAKGMRGVKAKVGYATVEEDLAVIRAIRAAVGSDVSLMVDYNQCLDPLEADNRISALSTERLEWIEEPVFAHDFQTLAALSRRTAHPLQAGENWWSAHEFAAAGALGATRRFMADVMKCGGVTGWLDVAAVASEMDLPLSSHLWPEVSAQLMYASGTGGIDGSWLEYVDWWNPINETPLQLENGYVVPPEAPGTGIALNKRALQRYQA